MDSITCPVCHLTSYNEFDITNKYCGNCHWWTSDELLGPAYKELYEDER